MESLVVNWGEEHILCEGPKVDLLAELLFMEDNYYRKQLSDSGMKDREDVVRILGIFHDDLVLKLHYDKNKGE